MVDLSMKRGTQLGILSKEGAPLCLSIVPEHHCAWSYNRLTACTIPKCHLRQSVWAPYQMLGNFWGSLGFCMELGHGALQAHWATCSYTNWWATSVHGLSLDVALVSFLHGPAAQMKKSNCWITMISVCQMYVLSQGCTPKQSQRNTLPACFLLADCSWCPEKEQTLPARLLQSTACWWVCRGAACMTCNRCMDCCDVFQLSQAWLERQSLNECCCDVIALQQLHTLQDSAHLSCDVQWLAADMPCKSIWKEKGRDPPKMKGSLWFTHLAWSPLPRLVGHRQLLAVARALKKDKEAAFELSIGNPDKVCILSLSIVWQ